MALSWDRHPPFSMIVSSDAPASSKSMAAPTLNECPEKRKLFTSFPRLAFSLFNIAPIDPLLSLLPTFPCRSTDLTMNPLS